MIRWNHGCISLWMVKTTNQYITVISCHHAIPISVHNRPSSSIVHVFCFLLLFFSFFIYLFWGWQEWIWLAYHVIDTYVIAIRGTIGNNEFLILAWLSVLCFWWGPLSRCNCTRIYLVTYMVSCHLNECWLGKIVIDYYMESRYFSDVFAWQERIIDIQHLMPFLWTWWVMMGPNHHFCAGMRFFPDE